MKLSEHADRTKTFYFYFNVSNAFLIYLRFSSKAAVFFFMSSDQNVCTQTCQITIDVNFHVLLSKQGAGGAGYEGVEREGGLLRSSL